MRPLAILALLMTTWSNAAVMRCAAIAPVSGEPHASAEHHEHAGHTSPTPDAPADEGQPDSNSHAQECGLVMACGAALSGAVATLERDLAGSRDGILHVAASAPTTTDLSQEPPPPRRLA